MTRGVEIVHKIRLLESLNPVEELISHRICAFDGKCLIPFKGMGTLLEWLLRQEFSTTQSHILHGLF